MSTNIAAAQTVAKEQTVSAPNAAISIKRVTLTEAGKTALSGGSYKGNDRSAPQQGAFKNKK